MVFACATTSCQTLTREDTYSKEQSAHIELVSSELEATELSKCIDANGETTGSLNIIWQIKNAGKEIEAPFITGFSGKLYSLSGTQIEFQAFTATKLADFTLPPVKNQRLFPKGSFSGFTLHFPFDEQVSGWAFMQLDGQRIKPSDVTGAELLIPKYVIGGEYSTRYYLKIAGGRFHEFSCQPISDELRKRLSSFQIRTGKHDHKGSRGRRTTLYLPPPQPKEHTSSENHENKNSNSAAAEELIQAMSEPEIGANKTKKETSSILDLRPVGRPKNYDETYQHVRIYECGENGSIDAIWKIRSDEKEELNAQGRFITGFAADLKDEKKKTAFYFSSIEIDAEPAFYSGTMPTSSTYYFPSLKFSQKSLATNQSAHSNITVLKKGERVAAATVYLPRNGQGEGVSVSLALGKSLRGTPYQATVNCMAVTAKLKHWFKNCLGGNSTQIANRSCNL